MSALLLLKLFLAPLFVALVSFIQRRWGDGIGGRLIGLPLTTGPFIFIIYIQEGGHFAARAAHGVLTGQIALIVFSWVYAKRALVRSWWIALLEGTLSCLITGYLATSVDIRLSLLLPLLVALWICAMKFWPKYLVHERVTIVPSWELPARIAVTVVLILTLTGFASVLGPRVAGALSTYPVIISVLGAFSQKRFGPHSTVATLHGLVQALPVTTAIMATLAIAL